jgi:hypothetical protein
MPASMNPGIQVEITCFLACSGHFLRHLWHLPRFKTQYLAWLRLCAVDGSQLRLPHEAAIIDAFLWLTSRQG